jgi:hypothetical protein
VALVICFGLTKRSSRPDRGCNFDQESSAKSTMAMPDVGKFSRSRSRISISPLATKSIVNS